MPKLDGVKILPETPGPEKVPPTGEPIKLIGVALIFVKFATI